jgi:hypothetical protein
MKLITQVSPTTWYFIPLQSKIFSSVPFSKALGLCLIKSGHTLFYETAHYLVGETEQMHKIFSREPVSMPKSESMMYLKQSKRK